MIGRAIRRRGVLWIGTRVRIHVGDLRAHDADAQRHLGGKRAAITTAAHDPIPRDDQERGHGLRGKKKPDQGDKARVHRKQRTATWVEMPIPTSPAARSAVYRTNIVIVVMVTSAPHSMTTMMVDLYLDWLRTVLDFRRAIHNRKQIKAVADTFTAAISDHVARLKARKGPEKTASLSMPFAVTPAKPGMEMTAMGMRLT